MLFLLFFVCLVIHCWEDDNDLDASFAKHLMSGKLMPEWLHPSCRDAKTFSEIHIQRWTREQSQSVLKKLFNFFLYESCQSLTGISSSISNLSWILVVIGSGGISKVRWPWMKGEFPGVDTIPITRHRAWDEQNLFFNKIKINTLSSVHLQIWHAEGKK